MSRSTDEERLLSLVPTDGSTINNRILREQLGWPDEKYEQAREKLVERGLILRGPGQGGTVRRADAEQASDDEEPEEPEEESNAELSRYEKKLLSLIPADGSTINNRILREELGWPDEKYEQARDKLVERGLILRGPGQGGTVRRADAEQASDDEEPEEPEEEESAELSRPEKKLLSLIPADGSTINNRILREELGWPDEKYEQARDKLVERGLILRGPGQGGTVRRADAEQASDEEEPEETLPKAIPVHVKDEEKLLALLPQDGASKGNRSLCEQLGWREEKYEAVRDQLVEKGLVVRGPGPGGTVRLTEGEERALLSQVPADGSAISSTRMVEVLGWPEGRYVQVRDRLIEKGLLTVPPGRGRGTSVCRPGAAKPPAVAVATPKPPAVAVATPKPPAVVAATPKPPAVAVATPKPPAVAAATPKPSAVAVATPKPPAAYDARRDRDEGPILEKPIKIFIAYVQSDEPLKKELLEYLHMLEKEQLIEIWHDHMITPGEDWRGVLNQQLREAEIILFLVSTVFLNSSYCNGDEMKTALARHDSGEAIVIPVILRPCMWHLNRLLSKLRALPKSDLPVTKWADRDDALTNVAQGIYDAVQKLIQKR